MAPETKTWKFGMAHVTRGIEGGQGSEKASSAMLICSIGGCAEYPTAAKRACGEPPDGQTLQLLPAYFLLHRVLHAQQRTSAPIVGRATSPLKKRGRGSVFQSACRCSAASPTTCCHLSRASAAAPACERRPSARLHNSRALQPRR